MGRLQEEARREDPAAKAELEAEAKAAAVVKVKAQAEERRQAEGRKKPGRLAAPPSEEPDPKAQKNFTDPESRFMKTKYGFIQGYNAQAAVDATAQVIVAHGLDAQQSHQHHLASIADAIEANPGKKPTQLSADAGYCSDANLTATEEREIDAYSAPGQAEHPGQGEATGRPRRRHARKNQGRRALQPLPLKKAAARAGIRTDQAGARLPSVSLARRREGRQRVGPPLPRPQYLEARPGAESVPGRTRNRRSFATSETVQRTMAAQLPPQPYIKPDARICCIRLSDWLERFEYPISPRIKQTGS